jgi:hypothetical protein
MEITNLKCNRNHNLNEKNPRNDDSIEYECDLCDLSGIEQSKYYNCNICDFDACLKCY